MLGVLQNAEADPSKFVMMDYLTDSCKKKIVDVQTTSYHGMEFNSKTKYSVCSDGSVSFLEPSTEGLLGWEGKCGETAISNTLKMICGRAWDPSGFLDSIASDPTPGTHPSTMKYSLNYFAEASGCSNTAWTNDRVAKSREDFISSLVKDLRLPSSFYRLRTDGKKIRRAPMPVLIYKPAVRILHWITVVDVIGYRPGIKLSEQKNCNVIFNQEGWQYTMPCDQLAGLAEAVGDAYFVGKIILGKFIRIKQITPL